MRGRDFGDASLKCNLNSDGILTPAGCSWCDQSVGGRMWQVVVRIAPKPAAYGAAIVKLEGSKALRSRMR